MLRPEDGFLLLEEVSDMQKLMTARRAMEKNGLAVLCNNDKSPLYMMSEVQSLMPLKKYYLTNDPLQYGFALVRYFAELFGPEKSARMLAIRKQTMSLLTMQDEAQKFLNKSLDESLNNMKDFLSQMSDFND